MTTPPTPTDAMVKALKPFAEVAEHDIGGSAADSDMFRPILRFNTVPQLTVGDLRRAHAAYTNALDAAALQHQEPGGAASDATMLNVKIVGGELVIKIGVRALAFAATLNEELTHFDQDENEWFHADVFDPAAFAKDVLSVLLSEKEDGTTPVHLMLDAAFVEACERGPFGVRLWGDDGYERPDTEKLARELHAAPASPPAPSALDRAVEAGGEEPDFDAMLQLAIGLDKAVAALEECASIFRIGDGNGLISREEFAKELHRRQSIAAAALSAIRGNGGGT